MNVDKDKAIVLGAQCVVFLGLLACVLMGHNNQVTDGLMAVAGLIVGGGTIGTIKPTKLLSALKGSKQSVSDHTD